MTDNTTTATAEFEPQTGTPYPTVDGQTFGLVDDGEGNWTAYTPAGEFEVVRDGDWDPSYLVTGPNHHYPDVWTDTFEDVIATLAILGTDGRTARHLVNR